MAGNKMEAVAHLFGKRLQERFTVNYYNHKFDCLFLDGVFEVMNTPEFSHNFDEEILYALLTSEAEIIDND